MAVARGLEAGPWGNDINPGTGAALVESVRADLLGIVRATAAERPAKIDAFVALRAAETMEAVKRFRNPELRPLFHALLAHEDWHVAHRALLALERYGDGDALATAWRLLDHAEPRLREKAAITCLVLWDEGGGKPGVKDPAADVVARLAAEGDPHVRACLKALEARVAKKLRIEKMNEEVRVKDADGLLWTPFLEGMDKGKSVAPGATLKSDARQGGGSAMKLPVARRFTTPILGYGREEVSGTSLQPFANLRNGTVYHTGQDVGACLDGAGFYACAEGIVKLVHSGSDMGTLIVLEHHVAEKEVATLLYMHGGDTVFVKAGDRVEAGHLLGSMGTGYSFENGGHYAHLHFGAYPGPFSMTHNYGYRNVAVGLRDWFDPAVVLPDWIDRTRPPADDPGTVARAARPVAALVREGRYADALRAADTALASSDLDEAARADLERMKASVTGAGDADPAFRKDVKAEARFRAALETEGGLVAKKDFAKLKALWEAVLADFGDTSLADRVKAKVAENEPRK